MNRYPSYQETVCDWIGEIPSNWNLTRGRFLFRSKKELNRDFQCENLLSLTLFGVLNKNYQSSDGLRPENYNTYQIFQKDDLVFKMIDLENVKTSRVGIVHEEGIMSPVYLRHEPIKNKIDPKFAYWFYYDLYKKEIYNSIGSGVRSSLSSSDLLEMELPVPPIEEQKRISRYLDKKTEQIDQLVEKIQKKIELLKEQRTSLINHYVTKGLDPNVEMKDSGIEWIGEIPKHWDVEKLKYLSKIDLSSVDRHEHQDELKVSICHYPDVYKNEYIFEDTILPTGTCSEDEFQKFSLKLGDIVLTKDSESAEDIGIPTYVSETLPNTVCGYHLAIVRVTSTEYDLRYVYRYIESKSVKDYFFTVSSGITRFGLGKGSIENLLLLKPPKNEQFEISNKLEEISATTEDVFNKHQDKISLLREYRQSLISSAVTGKIRITEDMI